MPRPNRTRFAVLGMLSLGEHSGYDLKRDFDRRMSHFWSESVGQIYPTLRRLLDEGHVRARRDPQGDGRGRTLYSLTASGRRELEQWLLQPPQPEQVRHELLLKLYFGPEMGAAAALDHLERYRSSQRERFELMESFKDEIVGATDSEEQRFFWRIALSSGLHVVRARLEWCDEAIRELRRREHSRSGHRNREREAS